MLQARMGEHVVRAAPIICPVCREPVVAKTGSLVTWHFAHKARADCDPWIERESDWHLDWKAECSVERTEVVIGPHRADALTPDGKIVEFQHSAISADEIRERERFYRDMVWVFDAREAYQANRARLERDGLIWDSPRRSIRICRMPVFLDLGDEFLFQVSDITTSRFERPVWEDGKPIYVRWAIDGDLWDRDHFVTEYLADPVETEPRQEGLWVAR
jgi:competence protein CoiA